MKVLRNDHNRGYTPLLDEILDPQNQLHGDFKEGYYIGVEANDSLDHKPFHGPNLWPASGNNYLGSTDTSEKRRLSVYVYEYCVRDVRVS